MKCRSCWGLSKEHGAIKKRLEQKIDKCRLRNQIDIFLSLSVYLLTSSCYASLPPQRIFALQQQQRSSFKPVTSCCAWGFSSNPFFNLHPAWCPHERIWAGIYSLHNISCDHDWTHVWDTRRCEGVLQETTPWAHWLEKSVVIGLVEKLQSADNPTEIAHGFSVRVENKHTRAEYLMNGPRMSPNCGVEGEQVRKQLLITWITVTIKRCDNSFSLQLRWKQVQNVRRWEEIKPPQADVLHSHQ